MAIQKVSHSGLNGHMYSCFTNGHNVVAVSFETAANHVHIADKMWVDF